MGPIQSGINSLVGTAVQGLVGKEVREQQAKRKAEAAEAQKAAEEKQRQDTKYETKYFNKTAEETSGKIFSPEDTKDIQNLESEFVNRAKFEQQRTKELIKSLGGEKTPEGQKVEELGQERATRNSEEYVKALRKMINEKSFINMQTGLVTARRDMIKSMEKEDN